MPSPLQQQGTEAERVAEQHLKAKGYRLLHRQWHCRYGELDLVMKDGQELVFVEVKQRATNDYGHPEEMVNHAKKQKLIRSAQAYITRYQRNEFWRFDTVAITGKGRDYEIEHFQDSIRDE